MVRPFDREFFASTPEAVVVNINRARVLCVVSHQEDRDVIGVGVVDYPKP